MPKQFEDGGIIKGKSHAQGGVPFVVKGSGQQIEVEGREAVISSKAFSDDKIHTYRGTNWDILNQINQKYGGNSLYEKVESIGVGDFVICISSVEDPNVREYTGTNEQVISAINESGGCVSMTKGAKVKEILDGRRSNKMAQGGAIDRKHDETYEKWRHLVNMSASELERFYNSDEGKKAGLTASEAKKQGIGSGRQSARWILRMKKTPKSEWTEEMWRWAGRQVNFISRMSGMKGDLYDDKGRKTRKHLSLLIWGHDPKKKMGGGSMMHLGGDVQNELRIKISNIKDSSKKYTGKYKDIFDIIEEDIVLYNPYGTTEEELIGTDFFITITPKPDNSKIEKIRLLKDVTILSSDSVMHLGGDMSKHLAPNGKPSNLTHEQWHLVRTPEFKAWFGDWENYDYQKNKQLKGSVVIDFKDYNNPSYKFTNEPIVVYHGTDSEFSAFDLDKTDAREKGWFGKGFYFSSNEEMAKGYGKNVKPYFLKLSNPFQFWGHQKDFADSFGVDYHKDYERYSETIREKLIELGYDGVIAHSVWGLEYVAFYPEQIKLADGTNTTFDGSNPDIRYAKGGSIGEIYRHKHIPTMTLEITGFTNNGVKGIQKDSSGNRLERTKGKAVTYSNDLLFDLFTLEYPLPQRDDFSMYARGGRTISQTPAPVKDRVYGSKTNRPDSAASGSSGSSIVLNDKTVSSISSIIAPYNKKHPNKKITMSVAKSVVRRGMGAYSSSHRPTISGGAANSRVAWGLARLKAFVYKAQNGHSKSGKYSQDNDLLNELSIKHSKFEDGGEILMGGKADGMTLADIAKEHGVSIKTVIEAYRDGMKHEMEHTTDHQVASEIAKDHIVERIDYYDMLDKAEKTYASGGIVKYFDKDNEDRLARPSGSIEKELLQKVNYDSSNFVGNFGWKTSDGSLADGYLLKLDEYDRDLVKDIKLKDGERIFRYLSRTSAIGGMTPMIKINLDKGLLYFLDVNDEDIIDFQTRGLKAEWVGVIPHKFEDGGKINWSEYYESGGHVGNPPSEFLDDQGNRKIDPATIAKLTKYVNALPQTKSFYFDETTGKYTPERRKIHIEIINSYKKGLVCIENANPIAILMGGSPASGKSSFLKKYSPYLLKDEIFKIDADDIRSKLPEYQGWNAAQTHLETKDIVNTIISDRNIGIPCNFDLIYDGTMNNVKSYVPLIKLLKDRGYKVFIVYMDNVDKDVITERALSRYKKSGRFVPLEVIDDFFAKGKDAFESLKQQVDGYMVVDGSNQDYNIIEQGGLKLPKNRKYGMLGRKIQPSEIPQEYASGGKINYSEALSNFEKAYGVDFLEVQQEFDKRLKQYQSMTYDDAFDVAVVALRLEKYLPDIYKDFIALWFSQTLPSKVPPQKNVWGKLDLGYLEDSREIAIMPASVKPISKYNTLYNDMGEAAFEEKAKIVAYCVDYDKKTVRPWSNGYYVSSGSDGYIAASNGSILMTISILNDGSASFNKYLGEKAGKVFDVKTGVKINDTFPPIERVIPNEQTNPLTILVSTRDLLSQVRAIDRANKFMQSRAKILVCIELMNKKYFYQSNLLLRVLEAFYDLGIERIRLNLSEEAHKALWIRKFDNTKQGFQLAQALVMPFAVKDDVAWYSIVYSDNVSVAGSTSQQPIQEQEQTTASAIQQTEKEVTPENQLFDKGDLTFLGVLVASFGVFKQAGIVTFTKTMTSGDPLKVTLTPFYDEETDSVNYIIETEPNRNYVLPTPKGTLNSLLQFPSGFKVSARDAYRIYLNEKRIIFDNLSNRAKNGFLSGKQNLLDV